MLGISQSRYRELFLVYVFDYEPALNKLKIKQLETIQSLNQLQGILQGLFYANMQGGEAIDEEKDYWLEAKEVAPYQYEVKHSYIDYLTDSGYENDEHLKHRATHNIFKVNQGTSVYKVVKDVLAEMETIYYADLPELKHKEDFITTDK